MRKYTKTADNKIIIEIAQDPEISEIDSEFICARKQQIQGQIANLQIELENLNNAQEKIDCLEIGESVEDEHSISHTKQI